MDGNASLSSGSESATNDETAEDESEDEGECDSEENDSEESDYDTEDEVDSEPIRPVLIQSTEAPDQLEVDTSEKLCAPTSLPLCLCLNARSVYNKKSNLKNILNTIAPCITIISESWERRALSLTEFLDSEHFSCVSFCRGRDDLTWTLPGPKVGGGAAIVYNNTRFAPEEEMIKVPDGVEAAWVILTPKQLDSRLQKVKRICVGSIYISPKSKYKDTTIEHIIHTIHTMRAKYNNEIHFYIGGDFNRVNVKQVLRSYCSLQQVCSVPTRQGATLELILTDLHTFYHPPTCLPPLKVDQGVKGQDSDHSILVWAPKASSRFKVEREKRKIVTRPLPQSQIDRFCSEFTQHKWLDVILAKDPNEKVEIFHKYLRTMLDKYFPEKTINVTNLDKEWLSPTLKLLLRQAQREMVRNGKSNKYRKLRNQFRRNKRKAIKSFYKHFVEELKQTKPSKYFQMLKKLGGMEQRINGKLEIECLKDMTDQEGAEAIAKEFAKVSQEYEPIKMEELPCYLPARAPEQVNIFQVLSKIKSLKKTKSTLPIDLPDKLRDECALDIAEPLTNIINSCLREGVFPIMWRREWVTPVPKFKGSLKTLNDVRKIASTSDYPKIFEKFLIEWIFEDIGTKININQFAGKKGVGTEHMIVCLVDRVESLLDKPGMRAVIAASTDWAAAFSRTDPTLSVKKMIKMGIRESLIPILVQFLSDRQMTVQFNSKTSKMYTLIGGGPQGSQNGQNTYICASDDNADHVPIDDQFKYCDDLEVLELVLLGDILTEYDFKQHVASDVGLNQKFLDSNGCKMQQNLDTIAKWTDDNLMQLNEEKSNYIIFTKAREEFAARLTLNNKLLERKNVTKLVGVWLEEKGGWARNTAEICKSAYAKISMLTKLKYAGVSTKDLVETYSLFIRSRAEYVSVAFHSSLTKKQERAIERIQSTCLKVILGEKYLSYEDALLKTGLKTLKQRREEKCLSFSLKCIKHPQLKRLFPLNDNPHLLRNKDKFKVNFAHTESYRKSAIPYCQQLLNKHMRNQVPVVDK